MAITPISPPAAGGARAQENQTVQTAAAPSGASDRGAATQVAERTLAVAETVRQNQEAARSTVTEGELNPPAESRADTAAAVERQPANAAAAQTNLLPPNVLRLVNA